MADAIRVLQLEDLKVRGSLSCPMTDRVEQIAEALNKDTFDDDSVRQLQYCRSKDNVRCMSIFAGFSADEKRKWQGSTKLVPTFCLAYSNQPRQLFSRNRP